MADDILLEINCPNCLSPLNVPEREAGAAGARIIYCEACQSRLLLHGHLCPRCGTYHREDVDFCRHCGTNLTRVCHKCRHVNWAGDEYCARCGEAMDIFELLSLQDRQARQELLALRREQMRELRALEEEAAQKRRAELEAIEAARQEELQRRLVEQRRRDRTLLLATVGGVVALLTFLLIYALFQLLI